MEITTENIGWFIAIGSISLVIGFKFFNTIKQKQSGKNNKQAGRDIN